MKHSNHQRCGCKMGNCRTGGVALKVGRDVPIAPPNFSTVRTTETARWGHHSLPFRKAAELVQSGSTKLTARCDPVAWFRVGGAALTTCADSQSYRRSDRGRTRPGGSTRDVRD